jgi:squalene-hopene/tetraprenyl-beta-curcumene cyclase
MNLMELVHRASEHGGSRSTAQLRSATRFSTELAGPVRSAILRARQFLLAERRGDGLWVGRESASPSLTSLLILWLVYAGEEDSQLAQQCAATLIQLQSSDGGWGRTAGQAVDLSVSVQCYFALKLLGIDPSSERLAPARQVIRQLGGADSAEATTRYLLALFGQVDYDICPDTPRRDPWSTIQLRRPVCRIEIDRGIRELYLRRPGEWPRLINSPTDGVICRPIDQMPFEHLFWHTVALRAEGLPVNSEQLQECGRRMRGLVNVDEDADTAWPRHDLSPRTDTALVARSLIASGVPPDQVAIAGAVDRVCAMLKPDVVDGLVGTTEVTDAISLGHRFDWQTDEDGALPPELSICEERSSDVFRGHREPVAVHTFTDRVDEMVRGLWEQQQSDGGWGAFDSTLPEADHSDVVATAAVLEALRASDSWEARTGLERAANFLRMTQCADGGWRRDLNADDVEATSAAVRGLVSIGILPDDEAVAAGVNWLIVHQELDGGWSAACHDDEESVLSAASPTAWAIMALAAAGRANHRATRRGVEFLVDAQDDDGRWTEFEIPPRDAVANCRPRNHLHSVAWPLLALSRWAVAADSAQLAGASEMSLMLVGISSEN